MADYNSSYTGPEIDAAVGAANTPDTTPASGSSALITSGGVYTALGSKADTKLGVYYARCDTTAATQVKVISIPEITELYDGLSILVRFTYYQNYNGVPQLQINNLPAKDIRRNSTNDAARYEWRATEVVHFVYSGAYFQIVDGETATTTYYGYTKLSSSTSSTSTSLAATPSAVKEAYDLANGKQAAITASGILKGDGAGAVSAAVAGTDYQAPLTADGCYFPCEYSVVSSRLSDVSGFVQRIGNIIMVALLGTAAEDLTNSSEIIRFSYEIAAGGFRIGLYANSNIVGGRINAGTGALAGVSRLYPNGNVASGASVTITGLFPIA